VALSTIEHRPALETERIRSLIDAALRRFVKFEDGCPPQLAEAIGYALLGPGKRLRPQLVLMAAAACGGSPEEALPAAAAVEMIHAYSLVHDDLPAMDDDDLRRGRPTCHKVYGEALAILVGDALQARAFEILASEIKPPARAARCCAVLGAAAGASALVGGQADDLCHFGFQVADCGLERANHDSDTSLSAPGSLLESIHRRKTGALFVASLELGGTVAGASDEQLAALSEFGRKLGLAFQITDDLLDVTSSEATIGKRVDKDAGRGKLTFPMLLGVAESRRRATALVDEACRSLAQFGPAADPLVSLARFIGSRNK
jgi:geranylgeranyl diphosphate synthase type II